jgi:hypothetical protein
MHPLLPDSGANAVKIFADNGHRQASPCAQRSLAVAIVIGARHATAFNQLQPPGEWKILRKEDAA